MNFEFFFANRYTLTYFFCAFDKLFSETLFTAGAGEVETSATVAADGL